MPRASGKTASWLPPKATEVNTSQVRKRKRAMPQDSALAGSAPRVHPIQMRIQFLSALAILLAAAPMTRAQRGTSRLEGTVTDSVHGRPLTGAIVLLTKSAPAPAAWYSATTDDRGRYAVDTLPAGQYSAALW